MKEIIHEILNDQLEIWFLPDGTTVKIIKQENLSEISKMIEDGLSKESAL